MTNINKKIDTGAVIDGAVAKAMQRLYLWLDSRFTGRDFCSEMVLSNATSIAGHCGYWTASCQPDPNSERQRCHIYVAG